MQGVRVELGIHGYFSYEEGIFAHIWLSMVGITFGMMMKSCVKYNMMVTDAICRSTMQDFNTGEDVKGGSMTAILVQRVLLIATIYFRFRYCLCRNVQLRNKW